MQSCLTVVEEVSDGVSLLQDKVDAGRCNTVYCICSVAAEFQVGAKVARWIFDHANLLTIDNSERVCPVFVSEELFSSRELFAEREAVPSARVRSVLVVLGEAYGADYKQGQSLRVQPAAVKSKLIEAFLRLVMTGFLPAKVENERFNHLGLTLLMQQCFAESAEAFVDYLRDPSALVVDDAELLAAKLTKASTALSVKVEPRPRTRREILFGHQDQVDILSRSEGSDANAKYQLAVKELEKLQKPSLAAMQAAFDEGTRYQADAAESALKQAAELMARYADTPSSDSTE